MSVTAENLKKEIEMRFDLEKFDSVMELKVKDLPVGCRVLIIDKDFKCLAEELQILLMSKFFIRLIKEPEYKEEQ